VRDLEGKVAVVTGAASGIGLGLAERFATERMKIILADVEEPALVRAEAALRKDGATVLGVPTDVSRPDQVDALAERALDAFGAVHIVCNNAGIAPPAPILDMTRADWDWLLGVNLGGVVNGIHTFMPILIDQDEGHVVNTGSMAGLITASLGAYSVTKHAVVALSEALHHSLQLRGSNVRVSVLCPGWVRTNLTDFERNRPAELRNPNPPDPDLAATRERLRELLASGMEPSEVAGRVVEAIREEQFYIVTHDAWKPLVEMRAQDILEGRAPTPLPTIDD
jgi:NAD(P)-dependent dehydrogenase (short-subunit alcohol dehydrogenase family)